MARKIANRNNRERGNGVQSLSRHVDQVDRSYLTTYENEDASCDGEQCHNYTEAIKG
jgi:hypothetical protein